MSAPGMPPSRFPPGTPLWPGLLLGAAAAAAVHYVRVSGLWPEAIPLPPGNHLHPVALFGHGLTLALLVTLGLAWLRLGARRPEAIDCEPHQGHWAGAAVRDCLDVLPARCTLRAYEKKLIERQERWARTLNRRWLWFYCAALAVFVPGVVLVPLNLRPPPQPLPDPVTLFEPLAVAAVETAVVFLLALRVRLGWGDVLQTWVEAALDAQKKTARLRRRRRPEEQPPQHWPTSLGPVDLPETPTLPTVTDPAALGSRLTPLPPGESFALPMEEEPRRRGSTVVPVVEPLAADSMDEVELVFDNDFYEEPQG